MKKKNYGFVKSVIDGSEIIFGSPAEETIPEKYSYREFLPNVIDQGALSICVPCSLSAYLNWKINIESGDVKDNSVQLFEIYKSRTNNGEGMTFKDAFKFLRHGGVSTNSGKVSIGTYGKINSINDLKSAIALNGPCFGALPVYNDRCEFWKKEGRDRLTGYHAISIVGYDEDGFIIRNSWGDKYCDNGYTKIKYDDFNKLIEIWTVID